MPDDGTNFTRNLEKVRQTFHNEVVKEAGVIADIVVANTQLVTPVKTGILKRSINRQQPVDNGRSATCNYGTDVPYAVPQNEGYTIKSGRFVQGRHYIEQGVLNSEDQVDDEIENWLDETLKEL